MRRRNMLHFFFFQKTKARESKEYCENIGLLEIGVIVKKPANRISTTITAPKIEKFQETKSQKLQEEKKIDAESIKKKRLKNKRAPKTNKQTKKSNFRTFPVSSKQTNKQTKKTTPIKMNVERRDKLP